MKAVFVKTKTGLVPCDEESQKLFEKLGDGELCMVEHTRGRDCNNHRRFFAFRNRTFEMQDVFDNDEVWRKQLHIMAGHFDTVIVPKPKWLLKVIEYMKKYLTGPKADWVISRIENEPQVVMIAKSIAYDAMDEFEFRDFFNKAINGFIQNYGNGITEDELLEVLQFERS